MLQVKLGIASPAQPEQSFEEKSWGETGALYSFVPEDRLTAIGGFIASQPAC